MKGVEFKTPWVLIPNPPDSEKLQIDRDTSLRFYVWWTSVPIDMKLQHAIRSKGFIDIGFWNHVLQVSTASTCKYINMIEKPLIEDAERWYNKNKYGNDGDLIHLSTKISLLVLLVGVSFIVWRRPRFY